MEILINNIQKYKSNIKQYPYYNQCKIDNNDDKLLIAYTKNDNLPEELTYARTSIFCEKTDKLLCYTFLAKLDYDTFIDNNQIQDIIISKYYDGTMINVYYDNNKWCISTKNVINGFSSKWYSRLSFAELFNQVKLFDYDTLDKKCCYSFVLQHTDNRIINKIDKNRVILVLVRNIDTLQFVDLASYQEKGFNIPEIIPNTFTSYETLNEYINNSNDCVMLYGINEQRTRLMTQKYLKLQSLMGNHRDKMYNILKLQSKNNTDLEFYYSQFPEHKVIQNRLFSLINQVINKLYDIYVLKFITHEKVAYPYVFNTFLYQIHQTYRNRLSKMNKFYAKMNHRVVKAIYYQLKPYYQYKLIINYDKYYNEKLTKLS